jgi:hypothetical protein
MTPTGCKKKEPSADGYNYYESIDYKAYDKKFGIDDGMDGLPMGALIGIIVGVVCLCCILVGCMWYRKNK